MPDDDRKIFETYLVDQSFPAGHCIIHQGDHGDGCYLVTSGTVRIEIEESSEGVDAVLGYIEAGGIVGEMSLAGLPEHSASVFAQTDVQLRRLSAPRYAELVREAPAIALEFMRFIAQDMARKVGQTNARLAGYISTEMSLVEANEIVEKAVAARSQFASPWAVEFLSDVPTDKEIVDTFLHRGIGTVCMVADSILSSMDQYLMELSAEGKANRWVVPSERSIPAVAVGRWLATGELTLMSMQNSGFTNAMDYLRTVMLTHRIPGIVLTSWRGFDAVLDDSEPHILVGDVTDADNCNTMGREHVYGHRTGVGLIHEICTAIDDAAGGNLVCIRVSPPGFSKSYPLKIVADARIPYLDPGRYASVAARKGKPFKKVQEEALRTRDEALEDIHEEMKPIDPFYIVGNGFNPRAMQSLRLTENTFENAGGMGSTLAIAWGAAKSNPRQVFVAIDGDQNAVMNEMEKVLASDYPDNLHWFILNNGTGESVGPSLSLPLCPWHYDLARVINTRNTPLGTFKHSRINASGLKFESEEARALAKEIGNLPAQAHLARRILAERM
jgi:CRP-like cAMP-binding protein/sulfopyruvate decarboxylase TPP-binding subunit